MKIFFCFFIGLFLLSCSTNMVNESPEKSSPKIVLADTDITFQTAKQKIRFTINSEGEIGLLKVYADSNPQAIYFNSNGFVDQIVNKKGTKKSNVTLFDLTGQPIKIKTFDLDSEAINEQFIWFASSASKSLSLNLDKSQIPTIVGLKDTFEINKDYPLTFALLQGINKFEVDHYEITDIIGQKDLKIQSEIKTAKIIIRSAKFGTYRLQGKVRLYYKKPKNAKLPYPLNSTEKVDILLQFK